MVDSVEKLTPCSPCNRIDVGAGIQWQRRPEEKWLAELLANKRAAGPLLEFLKDIQVGCREVAAEKAAEWRQRRDQDREDQLGDPYPLYTAKN